MLRWRLISAAIIISTMLLIIWLDLKIGTEEWWGRPGIIMAPIMLVVAMMAVAETLDLLSNGQNRPIPWAAYAGTALVIGLSLAPILWNHYPDDCPIGETGWPLLGMAAAVGLALLGHLMAYRGEANAATNVALTLFCVAYIGLLSCFMVLLRIFHDNTLGMVALLSLIVTAKLSDSFAYLVGKTIGRHKLAPVLSPGKTVEGMIGGLVGGCLGALIIFWVIQPWMTGQSVRPGFGIVIAFGIAVTVAGVLGDLAESMLKRQGNRKHSSSWLPGLGGVLDILDSLIGAAPVAYAFWASGLLGPYSS